MNFKSLNFELEIGKHANLKFAKKIINNNELQRKRVKTSKTIYSLLKNDLQKGCIMPPLVLALVKTDIIDIENPDQEKMLQYINEHRLNYASAMLECSNEDITSIYLDAGFESQRTFNRVFKDRFRMTPREYRKRFRE